MTIAKIRKECSAEFKAKVAMAAIINAEGKTPSQTPVPSEQN